MNVHKMRRAAQALTEDECVEVLRRGTAGVLALAGGPDEWPYAVPLSYAYRDGAVTFHGAMEGHKHELIAANPNASFCVIDADEVVPADYTTRYHGRGIQRRPPRGVPRGDFPLGWQDPRPAPARGAHDRQGVRRPDARAPCRRPLPRRGRGLGAAGVYWIEASGERPRHLTIQGDVFLDLVR